MAPSGLPPPPKVRKKERKKEVTIIIGNRFESIQREKRRKKGIL